MKKNSKKVQTIFLRKLGQARVGCKQDKVDKKSNLPKIMKQIVIIT
jgi:hypothetical protein